MKGSMRLITLLFLCCMINTTGNCQIRPSKNLVEKKHKLICTAYSKDGKYIATGGADNVIVLWDVASGTIQKRFFGLQGFPITLCFDSETKYLASGGKDKIITIWDVGKGSVRFVLRGHRDDILSVKISPDNQFVASTGIDGMIKIWNLNTGAFVKDLRGHSKQVNTLDYNLTGDKLISGSADKTIIVWNLTKGVIEKQFTAHSNWIRNVAYSPDQKYIASCGDDNIINIWDANTYELVNTLRAHKNFVMDICFSPDGRYLISGGHDNRIVLFDLNTGSIKFQSLKQNDYVLSLDFNPNGKDFASVTLFADQLTIWDASSLNISNQLIEETREKAAVSVETKNPPVLTWVNPVKENYEVSSAVTSIETNIQTESDLNSVEIYINDKLFASEMKSDLKNIVNNNYQYKHNVFLKTGENKVKIVAKNSAGEGVSTIRNIVYKLPQKPQISWITPNSGEINTSGSNFDIASNIASNTNINKVDLYINDILVATDNNLTVSAANDFMVSYEKSLLLNDGKNTVKIMATNSAGSTTSDPVIINCSKQQVVAARDYTAPPNPYRFALIIGNEDYSSYQVGLNSESDVEFAKKDAEDFHKYAIKFLGVPEDQAVIKVNARYIDMRRELKKISGIIEMTNGKAEIFFYYAGHGFPHEKTKEPYLVPVDGSGTDLEFSAIKLSEVYAELTKFPSKRVTVFLDACFSGGGRNQGLVEARAVKVKPKEETLMKSLVVFSASSGDETSLPYKEKEHGMFTYFLLQKIEESKGSVSYKELSDYIREQVGIKSYVVNSKKQEPQVNISPSVINDWAEWKLR